LVPWLSGLRTYISYPSSPHKDMKINDLVNLFPDGVLVLNHEGDVVFSNTYANQICQKLLEETPATAPVAEEIWQLYQLLKKAGEGAIAPERLALMEGEFFTGPSHDIRVRIQTIHLDQMEGICFLIVLEDRQETVRRAAIAEIKKFKLTPREAEVWVWRRMGMTYHEIADKLFVTIDTVKKHLKNIYAKRDATGWAEQA